MNIPRQRRDRTLGSASRAAPSWLVAGFLTFLIARPLLAASMNEMDHGPFVSWTIRGEGESVTYKGIVVRLSDDPPAALCFDTDLLRVSAAWTGGLLQWYPERDGLERNPTIRGAIHHVNDSGPGWTANGSFTDPRPLPYGPLPLDWGHYEGLYVNGTNVVLSYSVAGCRVLELPGFLRFGSDPFIVRTLNLSASARPLTLRLFKLPGANARISVRETAGPDVLRVSSDARNRLVGFSELPRGARWELSDGHLCLQLPPFVEPIRFRLLISDEPQTAINPLQGQLKSLVVASTPLPALRDLCKGGPTRWKPSLETASSHGAGDYALAVDTLTVPEQNPWHSWIRFGGVDFLDADRAILGSVSGDVWLVSGLARSDGTLTWKRFATGLYQPLDVKIVAGQIYVLGRDQITRLHDLNGDGEADFYENFNNAWMVAENFHAFVLNLETDSHGNFFFAEGAPWPPEVKHPHQGVLFQLSPDGKRLEVYADGLRGPNGMAIGPDDLIVYSDNEGHWIPTCSVQWVRKGGFHGMKPTAHLHPQTPTDFEKPICWIPHDIDNSLGDLVWVPPGKWGPLANKLLLTSYGKATLSLVLTETLNGMRQGGVVQLPLKFQSGLIRARFNPYDDHLYVCGLSIWQTAGVRPGGFYRIRYTGKPFHVPVQLSLNREGVRLTFSEPLDRPSASDTGSFNIEQWNYRWVETYGSPHYSAKEPERKGHDLVSIRGAELSEDGRTVVLRTEPLQPVMQMHIAYDLQSAAGARLRQHIYNTVNTLP